MAETPAPHSVEAEEAVIGSLLTAPELFGELSPILEPGDFYLRKLRFVWNAIERLHNKGVVIDPVTITEDLDSVGKLDEIGGMVYILDLINRTPTTQHVTEYANIVREKSVRRRMIDAASSIARLAYAEGTPLDQCVAESESEMKHVVHGSNAMRGTGKTPAEIGGEFKDSLHQGFGAISLGISELDIALGGAFPEEVIIVASRPGIGKCLGAGTKVLMYNGSLKKVEDIIPGDQLMGPDSKPRNVLTTTTGVEKMYWVRQRYGVDYRVNESHILSLKRSKNEEKWKHGDVKNFSISEVVDKGPGFWGRWKGYKVGVEFPPKDLPLEPYFLGLWLGDGKSTDSRVYSSDEEVGDYLREYAFRLQRYVAEKQDSENCKSYRIVDGKRGPGSSGSINSILGNMRLIGNKHIPSKYIINSRENRLAILAGLIDSDGYMDSRRGGYEITQKSKTLALDIKFLCDTLGLRATVSEKAAKIYGVDKGLVYRIVINGDLSDLPVRIPRKKQSHVMIYDWTMSAITIDEDCIDRYYGFEIDGDGLFLLEDMTVTHNTAFVLQIARTVAFNKHRVLLFSLEMQRLQLWARMTVPASGLDWRDVRMDAIDDVDRQVLSDIADRLAESLTDKVTGESYLIIDDTPGATVFDIRRAVAFYKPDLVIIDQLPDLKWHVPNAKKVDWYGEAMQFFKVEIARKFHIPVIVVAQINRAVEARQDKRPMASDLRDSGEIEQKADIVLLGYREDIYEGRSPSQTVVPIEWDVAKHRQGSTCDRIIMDYDLEAQWFGG